MVEPGLDLHEWETRWQELLDAAADEPEQTLPEMTRFIEQALSGRGFQLDEPVTFEGEDADIAHDFLAAREIAAAVETEPVDPGDVADAIENLQEIYDYLVADRPAP